MKAFFCETIFVFCTRKVLLQIMKSTTQNGDMKLKLFIISHIWKLYSKCWLILLLLLLLLSHFSRVWLCDPVRPQPTRLPHPWDSPGKNTGVGCHLLLQCMKVKSESEVAQSCPTLSDPMDCSPPGSSSHGILQARGLEWGATAFSVDWFYSSAMSSESQFLSPHSPSSVCFMLGLFFSHAHSQPQSVFRSHVVEN